MIILLQLILSSVLAWFMVQFRDQNNIEGMLSIYSQQQRPHKQKKVLFTFSVNEDLSVNALDLLKELNCSQHNPTQICDQIIDHFKHGLGSECHVTKDFENLVKISKNISTKQDLGGNSGQMALRAFKEGADVYLSGMMSQSYYKKLFNSTLTVVPQNLLIENLNDVHIVVNYQIGEQYENITCPRTNRLYLQNDRENMKFPGIDTLEEQIQQIQPDLFVIAGFQLMNQQPISEYQDIVLKLEYLLANTQMKVHFELGAFTDPELLQFLTKHLLPKVHSTGMNEQELYMFYQFLKEGTIQEYTDLSTNEQIKMVIDLLEIMDFQRIHFHSQNIQMICSDKSWGPVKQALHRSILVGLIQVRKEQNDNRIEYGYDDTSNLNINLIDDIIALYPSDQYVSQDDLQRNPLSCWQYKDKECCIAPILIHSEPLRQCSLGDNIAATSLLQQI